MLYNCLTCGKSISSKQDICVYCKADNTLFINELRTAKKPLLPSNALKEKYAGTFFSLLFKGRL